MLQPATDNLYKFMAISGLLVAGFFFVYPYSRFIEIGREVPKLHRERNRFEIEAKFLTADADSLDKTMANLQGEIDEYKKDLTALDKIKGTKNGRVSQKQ